MSTALLKRTSDSPLQVGARHPTRVMALVGESHSPTNQAQLKKIDALAKMDQRPDAVADLSIVNLDPPLWRRVIDLGFVSSTLPVYTVEYRNRQFDRKELLDRSIMQMEGGISMLTIHPTPTIALVELAQQRRVPWTSRGGGLIIEDLLRKPGRDNAYMEILPELAACARQHHVVLSLGASFRSANIFDSLDDAQLVEINSQIELANLLSEQGNMVVIESPGHARPKDIQRVAKVLAKSGHPIMPLGPIPTDVAIGQDHISAAIGATILGMGGAAHILAAVTREEHTGGVPTLGSTVEAVRAARLAAHIIDIHLLGATEADEVVVSKRTTHKTCVVGKASSGCARCGHTCPLR